MVENPELFTAVYLGQWCDDESYNQPVHGCTYYLTGEEVKLGVAADHDLLAYIWSVAGKTTILLEATAAESDEQNYHVSVTERMLSDSSVPDPGPIGETETEAPLLRIPGELSSENHPHAIRAFLRMIVVMDEGTTATNIITPQQLNSPRIVAG